MPLLLLGAFVLCANAAEAQPVNLGLVVPGKGPFERVGREMRAGAALAVRHANEAGGLDGRPFALVVRTQEGLWGKGLGQVVDLSFEADVVGVVGGVDGRSAHLIQQVVTKARIPYLSPWATDYTLSRGFIPWFFQIVPDDRQQAVAAAKLLASQGARRVGVAADTTYDGTRAWEALETAAKESGVQLERIPVQWAMREGAVLRPFDATIILAGHEETRAVLQRATREHLEVPLFLWLNAATPEVLRAATAYRGSVNVPSLGSGTADRLARFAADFIAENDMQPGLTAAYTYDAVTILIEAVRTVGVSPHALREQLAAQVFANGLTGPVLFDASGRRETPVRYTTVVRP